MEKITRRSMFSAIAMALAGTVAIARAEYDDRVPTKDDNDGGTFYRGYRMYFTGWKFSQCHDLLAAQWVGYPVDRNRNYIQDNRLPFLVAPVPGHNSAYRKGDMFDIAPKGQQIYINWKTTSEAEKDHQARLSNKDLIKMIDIVVDSGRYSLDVEGWNQMFFNHGMRY